MALTVSPIDPIDVIIATTMSAAIRPYSIAVAPRSLRHNRRANLLHMFVFQSQVFPIAGLADLGLKKRL